MAEEKSGAHHLVDALKETGVTTIFSLSGNQIMPVYDALIDSGMRLIHTRHEGAAVYMAEAYAQLTGEIGVALLTAGPGFANAMSAMWTAKESRTPILVLSGDAPLKMAGMGAFQEMDQQRGAAEFASATFKASDAASLRNMTSEAIDLAHDYPGPVHISLPDDVLRETAAASESTTCTGFEITSDLIDDANLSLSSDIINKLKTAKRPIILAGPEDAHATGKSGRASCAASTGIPFIGLESPRGMRAPRIGALAEVLPEVDLAILVSLTPNFLLGFGNAPPFGDNTKFVCFSDDIDALKRAKLRLGDRITTVGMEGTRALVSLGYDGEDISELRENAVEPGWRERVEEAMNWRPPEWRDIPADAPPFHAASVAYEIKKFLDANSEMSLIIDGGEVGQWCQSILDSHYSIINGPSGAIGGSIPYGIAAKAARPDQPAIAILGDGTAGFYFMEFETAIREELPFIAIVGNDAKWNAEHQIQVRDYGENRTFGCEMNPTRYDEVAKAMGAYSENITDITEIVPAIERAIASARPACLNIEIQSIPAPAIKRTA